MMNPGAEGRGFMKLYIAARFEHRPELRPYRDQLWALGHQVVSTWLDEVARPEGMSKKVFWKKLALKDVAEIKSADVLILDTHVASDRGGKEVEYGIALGGFQTQQLWIVGPQRNVFHELADLVFADWDECIAYVSEHYPIHESALQGGGLE